MLRDCSGKSVIVPGLDHNIQLNSPPPARVPLVIGLIGPMRAEAPDGRSALPRGRKTRGLLACLCLARGERLSRNRLAGLLWDRSAETQAKTSLRHAIAELVRSLAESAPHLITIDREGLCLDPRACRIDALCLIDTGAAAAPQNIRELRACADRLLEDLEGLSPSFDQWLAAERTRFGDELRSLLEAEMVRLVDGKTDARQREAAARRLISFDSTHEGAVRTLMRALAEMGDRAQALREYERCREALQRMLDAEPSKETAALSEAIRRLPSSAESAPPAVPDDRRSSRPPAAAPERPGSASTDVLRPVEFSHRPSIAILPLRALTTDAGADVIIAEGIADDIIESLSRLGSFFVISRLSTLVFKETARHPREIGEMLGVRYVLSGSLRRSGERCRVTVELADTQVGAALWAVRFDESVADIFRLQDRISEGVVRRLAPHLHQAELRRARSKRPESLQAYDLVLQAIDRMHNSAREVFETARGLFDRAIAQEPDYAAAYAWRAYWHALRVAQGWSGDPAMDTAEAERFAAMGVERDGVEPMALAVHGHVIMYLRKNFDLGFRRLEKALEINPNSALAHAWSGVGHAWRGNGSIAVEQTDQAIALSPFDPLMYSYYGMAGMANLIDGRYERAIEFGLKCAEGNGTYTHAYRLLAFAYALTGRIGDAREAGQRLLAIEPNLTVERFRRRYPGNGSAHTEVLCDALATAGIPRGGHD